MDALLQSSKGAAFAPGRSTYHVNSTTTLGFCVYETMVHTSIMGMHGFDDEKALGGASSTIPIQHATIRPMWRQTCELVS